MKKKYLVSMTDISRVNIEITRTKTRFDAKNGKCFPSILIIGIIIIIIIGITPVFSTHSLRFKVTISC